MNIRLKRNQSLKNGLGQWLRIIFIACLLMIVPALLQKSTMGLSEAKAILLQTSVRVCPIPIEKASALLPLQTALSHVVYLTPSQKQARQINWSDQSQSNNSGCEMASLPFPTNQVRWVGLISSAQAKFYQAQGLILNLDGTQPLEPIPAIKGIEPLSRGPQHEFEALAGQWLQAKQSTVAANPDSNMQTRFLGRLSDHQGSERSMWVWESKNWETNPQLLLQHVSQVGVKRLYVDIPLERKTLAIKHPEALKRFLALAAENHIDIWVVEGSADAILSENQTYWFRRANQYKVFNQNLPQSQRFRGLQYDIEPYLMNGYQLHPELWHEAYLQFFQTLLPQTALPLEVVLPFWFADAKRLNGTLLLDALQPLVEQVTIMDYRTQDKELLQFAEPYFNWSNQSNRPIQIALELGPLPPESYWVYRSSGGLLSTRRGDLWLMPWKPGYYWVVLLRSPQRASAGVAFELSHQLTMAPEKLTYHSHQAQFWSHLTRLEHQFQARSSHFTGIALHHYDALDWGKTDY